MEDDQCSRILGTIGLPLIMHGIRKKSRIVQTPCLSGKPSHVTNLRVVGIALLVTESTTGRRYQQQSMINQSFSLFINIFLHKVMRSMCSFAIACSKTVGKS